MKIHEAQFEWIIAHQQIGRMQVLLDHTSLMHSFNKAQNSFEVGVRNLIDGEPVKSFRDEDALVNAGPSPPLSQRHVTHYGNLARLEPPS